MCTVHNLPLPSVSKDTSEVAAVRVEPVAPRNLADCRQGFVRTDTGAARYKPTAGLHGVASRKPNLNCIRCPCAGHDGIGGCELRSRSALDGKEC